MPSSYADNSITPAERDWAIGQHLIGLLSLADMTFLGLIGAIVMWRLRCRESAWLDDHGREAVNFQFSLLLYAVVGSLVVTLLSLIVFAVFTVPLWLLALVVLRVWCCVLAARAANRREYFRYPMCIRFFSPRLAA